MSKLRQIRRDKHLTQAFMAGLIGVSLPTYNKKENGNLDFSILEAYKVSNYFGKSIEDVFELSKTETLQEKA